MAVNVSTVSVINVCRQQRMKLYVKTIECTKMKNTNKISDETRNAYTDSKCTIVHFIVLPYEYNVVLHIFFPHRVSF